MAIDDCGCFCLCAVRRVFHKGLMLMLDALEDERPLVKLTTRTWLRYVIVVEWLHKCGTSVGAFYDHKYQLNRGYPALLAVKLNDQNGSCW